MANFLLHLAFVFLLIAVHEGGHYLVGRLAGIPGKHIRIRWLAFPQYVSVRFQERWLSPSDVGEYVTAVWHYLKIRPRVYWYVAGGFLLETLFTVPAFILFLTFGLENLATPLVRMSAALLLPWLLIDTVMIVRGQIMGDFSALWQLSPWPTAVFMIAMVLVRVLLFVFV
jgi:hypothetical protein